MSDEDKTPTEVEEVEAPLDPLYDTTPTLMLGAQAVAGVTYWALSLFLFLKTNETDADLSPSKMPVAWFWKNLGDKKLGHVAGMYASIFFLYLMISGTELMGYAMFQMGDPSLMMYMVPTIGFWGTIMFYPLPVMMALKDLHDMNWNSTLPFYTNDLILGVIVGATLHVVHSLVHIFYTTRFMNHATAFLEAGGCVCD